MPRVMEKVIPVKITTDEINCYATINRNMIGGITACMRLLNKKGIHAKAQIKKLQEVKKWAEAHYDGCIESEMDLITSPPEG